MQTPQPTTYSLSPQHEAILTSLAQGASRTSACHAAGLPRRTFYNWIDADPVFAEAVEEAEAESIAAVENLAYACAMKAEEDPRYLRALSFWLKHKAGWVQARPTPAGGARHAVPSPDPNAPPVDTADLALVMNLVKDFERGSREDEELMRGYEEWKQLSEEEREAIRQEEQVTFRDSRSSSNDASEGNPAFGVASVPSESTEPAVPEENPGIGVSFVPSKPFANPKSAIQNPKSVVPSVPSRKRDRMHQQRFKKKRRR